MKYRNIKTGFVFESDSLCKGEGWEPISSSPASPKKAEPKKEEPKKEEPKQEEPAKPKRNTKGKTK